MPERVDVDLLIIGSGAGSMAAALRATEAGRSVLIVEKQDKIGGSTAMSGGVVWIPDNPLLKEAGLVDSVERARTYLDACIGPETPATSSARRDAFLTAGPECVSLMRRGGVKLHSMTRYPDYFEGTRPGGSAGGRSIVAECFDLRELGKWQDRLNGAGVMPPVPYSDVPDLEMRGKTARSRSAMLRVAWRMLRNRLGAKIVGMGSALYGRLLQAVIRQGAQLWSNVRVAGLIVEAGQVVGADVVRGEEKVEIRARYGVLLNSGGFARNQAMIDKYQKAPSSADWSFGNPGDTGEIIEMVVDELGAATSHMDAAWFAPGAYGPTGITGMVHEMQYPHTLVVDGTARRYMNEGSDYVMAGYAMHERNTIAPAVPSWFMFDHQFVRKNYLFAMKPASKIVPAWVAAGLIVKANSLAELARLCELPAGPLADTIARFNGFATRGVDEDFGRGMSSYDRVYGDANHKPTPGLGDLKVAPFYAVKLYPSFVGTCGGLLTDEYARVVRADGEPIAGLYATGNCTASVMGYGYPGAGATLGPTLTFGYIAAGHALRGNAEV